MLKPSELQDFSHFLKLKFNAEVIVGVGTEELLRAFVDDAMVVVRQQSDEELTVECSDPAVVKKIADKWGRSGLL